ncbi:MAG: TRAP transporter small permease [Rhodospirillales bacterium]|nr:TRAP transporter small permease [Rhodospirillales bacterium]
MRQTLARLYRLCGVLAGLCLVLMLAMIVLNIAGGVFGFFVRGLDAYAGYLMAAASCLAFSYTLKAGEHIRVTLFLQRTQGPYRRLFEIVCLLVAVFLSGFFAWYTVRMAWLSWKIDDISQMTDRTPLWMPQSVFAFGAVVLFIAFAEELIDEILGRRVHNKPGEGPAHIE